MAKPLLLKIRSTSKVWNLLRTWNCKRPRLWSRRQLPRSQGVGFDEYMQSDRDPAIGVLFDDFEKAGAHVGRKVMNVSDEESQLEHNAFLPMPSMQWRPNRTAGEIRRRKRTQGFGSPRKTRAPTAPGRSEDVPMRKKNDCFCGSYRLPGAPSCAQLFGVDKNHWRKPWQQQARRENARSTRS